MSNSDLAKRYIGKQISLISTSHVRYEGYLYTIDEQAQTVALQNVVCMGTEGRRHGDEAIGPSDTTYEFIIFRGVNIQHFYVKSDEGPGKPTVDKTGELFNALGIEDEDDHHHYEQRRYRDRQSNSRGHKQDRPSSRLVLADDKTPKRRVGRGDMSPRDDYYYPPPRQYDYPYGREPWAYGPPGYPRGGYGPRGPAPRGRRERGRPRYDDRYEPRGGRRPDVRPRERRRSERQYNEPPPRRERDGRRGGRRAQNQTSGNNNSGSRRERQGRRSSNQNSRATGNTASNNNNNNAGKDGGRRKQAGTGEFLTKAGRGEELEINEDQLFDFEEAKTKFSREADVAEAKAADEMGENKAASDSRMEPEDYGNGADDQKINDTESPEVVKNVPSVEDGLSSSHELSYDASRSFFDSLSTDNAQRTKSGRPDMNEQRNVDARTFGSIGQTYKSSHLRPSGGNRGDKSRNRRFTKSNQNRSRRRVSNRRQRAPPVQRQWQPRQ